MITRIRIPSYWRDPDGKQHHGLADFKLGLGTCGKVVTRLDVDCAAFAISILQVTEDGESKTFIYLHSQITGRIEITEND